VLRRARLLTVEPGPGLVASPLAIEEAVLNELAGRPHVDERLRPLLEPLAPPSDGDEMLSSHHRAVNRLIAFWSEQPSGGKRPAALLVAKDRSVQRLIAAAAASEVGFRAFSLDPAWLPEDPSANEELIDLWQRDSVLHDFVLMIEVDEVHGAAERLSRRWIERLPGFVLVAGSGLQGPLERPLVRIDVDVPQAEEQSRLWRSALGSLADTMNGGLDALAQQFPLSPRAVREVVTELRGLLTDQNADAGDLLWQVTRRRARGGLDALAQRLEPVARWDDLVLPRAQMEVLRTIAVHVRRRAMVYDGWGFAGTSRRGLGIGALFTGPSGTGKTMAAEVLALDLGLDVYRIDLSAVVSKYIGETEKNLSRLFGAAEASGAILLFDEADAIFGKRSEVRDSHDRYANLEVSYLLQRIESYRGLAILTTNLDKNLDQAFLRRLRFVVQFPFPGPVERREIWRRIFPAETPTENLDWERLAQLAVAGGNIRNIAIGAAFRAADEARALNMADLAEAARAELAKSGKSLSESQIEGWR
jgi:hypothetical protein